MVRGLAGASAISLPRLPSGVERKTLNLDLGKVAGECGDQGDEEKSESFFFFCISSLNAYATTECVICCVCLSISGMSIISGVTCCIMFLNLFYMFAYITCTAYIGDCVILCVCFSICYLFLYLLYMIAYLVPLVLVR